MDITKEINYDDSDSDEEEREILKNCFELEDFLKYKPTRKILKNEHRSDFEKICEPKLETFYEKQVEMCREHGSTLFENENECEHMGTFLGTVYSFIIPNYNLNIFYDTPSLATEMVKTYEERLIKDEQDRMKGIRANYNATKNANKTFDWSSKTYKNN